jgi:hypothetical protein
VTRDDFDAVRDALQERRDKLWKMTQQNMRSGTFNVMDSLRLEQIEKLDDAIAALAEPPPAAPSGEGT